jgi:hypothetical protein
MTWFVVAIRAGAERRYKIIETFNAVENMRDSILDEGHYYPIRVEDEQGRTILEESELHRLGR